MSEDNVVLSVFPAGSYTHILMFKKNHHFDHLSFGFSAAYPFKGEVMRDKVATEDLNVKLSALRHLSGCGNVIASPSTNDKKVALKKSKFFMQVLQGGSKASRVPCATSPPLQKLQKRDKKREVTSKPHWTRFSNVEGERGDAITITTPTGRSGQVDTAGKNSAQDMKKMEMLLSRSKLSRSITSPTSSHKAASP